MRISVGITTEKLKEYISKGANLLGMSKSSFIEYILEMSRKNINYLDPKRDFDDFSFFMKESKVLYKKDINNTDENQNYYIIPRESVEFDISVKISNILHEGKFSGKPYNEKTVKNLVKYNISKFFETNENYMFKLAERLSYIIDTAQWQTLYFVPLMFLNIKEITFIDGVDDGGFEKELVNCHNESKGELLKFTSEEKKDRKSRYEKTLEYIGHLLTHHTFNINVKVEGWFLPVHLNILTLVSHGNYDFLNAKYRRYKGFEENTKFDKNPFIYLLKGDLGYIYCDIFDTPKDDTYFINKHKKMRNDKSSNYNSSTKVLLDGTILSINPDLPAIKNKSRLLKRITTSLNEINTSIRNAS